jgi:endonuclease YncB( thermonuclease family)
MMAVVSFYMIGRKAGEMRRIGWLICVPLSVLLACGAELAPDGGRMSRLFLEVQDGDTVVYRRVPMRFLGVDSPEIKNPGLGFFEDQPYGRDAKEYTRAELRGAKRVTYSSSGYDIYGRLLVHVFVDGYPLSLKIVEAGLGYETVSFYGDNGFPEISAKILAAARANPDLPFEHPYLWRAKHRRF